MKIQLDNLEKKRNRKIHLVDLKKVLESVYLVVKIGVDTAGNEPTIAPNYATFQSASEVMNLVMIAPRPGRPPP